MARQKDFSQFDAGAVSRSIAMGTGKKGQQPPITEEEANARKAELRTQGRWGVQLPRINMAFTPENHEFLKIISKAKGQTMTQLNNLIIEAYRREHPEMMEKAKAMLEEINSEAALLG